MSIGSESDASTTVRPLRGAVSLASPLGQGERIKVRGLKETRLNYPWRTLTLPLSLQRARRPVRAHQIAFEG